MFPRRQLLTWAVFPLALNALLYLAYRDWSLWCFRWVELGGTTEPVRALRRAAAELGTPGEFVRFSLSSGLWIFGVSCALLLLRSGPKARLWITGILALCLASEVAQCQGLLQGTADWNDVFAYIAGVSLALGTNRVRNSAAPPWESRPASLSFVAAALLMATGAIQGPGSLFP